MAEPLLYAALHIGAVAIGIAQRALTEIVALANTNKRRLYASASLAESSAVSVSSGTRGRESARRSQPAAQSGGRRMEFGSRRESSFNRRPRAGDGLDHVGGPHLRGGRRYLLQGRRRHIAVRRLPAPTMHARHSDADPTRRRRRVMADDGRRHNPRPPRRLRGVNSDSLLPRRRRVRVEDICAA